MSLIPPSRPPMPDPSVALMIIAIGVQALGLTWKSSTRRAFKAAVNTVVTTIAPDDATTQAKPRDTDIWAASHAAQARAYWLALMAKFPD